LIRQQKQLNEADKCPVRVTIQVQLHQRPLLSCVLSPKALAIGDPEEVSAVFEVEEAVGCLC
jgi:hypothetical protein